MAKRNNLIKKKKRKKLSEIEIEQRSQRREIIALLKNVGFKNASYIDGKEFTYEGRVSEMDDIFVCENIILITEYTIGDPGTHLIKKDVFYRKVLSDTRSFVRFMLAEEKLKGFKKIYEEQIQNKYSFNELRVKILYCSKKKIEEQFKGIVSGEIIFFDYHIVQYFKSLTKVIKKSSKFEFLDFLNIPFHEFGVSIKDSPLGTTNKFSGHILPEERSSFQEGYKIVSFYIDAASLMKRAYVLRQNGWRDLDNIGHYQRMFESSKITSMRKYLTEKSRVFINNIISTISVDKVTLLDKDENQLVLNDNGQFVGSNSSIVTPAYINIKDECNIIGLIDGQHRTFAYHEGDDQFEVNISKLRNVQNLLVTGILFPKNVGKEARLKFEATLFLEINSNQTNVRSQLRQDIELMILPFSTVAIGKKILRRLNKSGPLSNRIEEYWYEKGKLKTASIVSFALKPLLKLEDVKSSDSLFYLWDNPNKSNLKIKDSQEFDLLNEYVGFCVEKIRDLLIGFKANLKPEQWEAYSPSTPKGLLTVTTINGILNVLRKLIENNKVGDSKFYIAKLKGVDSYNFKSFKSSQYRKLGEDIYDKYF